ncbi:hypothetical protein HG537_0E06020 [Torulaspora globosa]|uniref:Uncharacterized protein n=2 Tax=Torulaspora globosa TaxID=48254 RepID=A0A7H9HXK6_9SACH|nr:hypothetical protein HG537_0E06020 [Torulaspora sp. CBS 2947]
MSPLEYSSEVQQLLEWDREHLWHPFSTLTNPFPVYPVRSAMGCQITLDTTDQQKVVEAMSSWWCVIHGYDNQELKDAMKQQLDQMSHVMFGGLTHKPAVELGKKLLRVIDHPRLHSIFFADTGSVAVEVAMKLAIQYNHTVKQGAGKFLTIRNGYHGDTFGAMSVGDPSNPMRSFFKEHLPQNIFVKAPTLLHTLPTSTICLENPELFQESTKWHPEDFAEFQKAIDEHHDSICAVILEPLLQGAGGVRLYHPQFLIEARKACNKYAIPFIMDEIATGFGRTGEIFAFKHCREYQRLSNVPPEEQVDVFPDILCVGKGLTGGYMSFSAVVTTAEIAGGVSMPDGPTRGYFMHGPTFMGNPLACSVANKSLDILLRGEWKNQVRAIEKQLFQELYLDITRDERLMKSVVDHIRVAGAVGVVQLQNPVNVPWFQEQCILRNVYIRPFKNLCYIIPPFTISREELTVVTRAIKEVLNVCLNQV